MNFNVIYNGLVEDHKRALAKLDDNAADSRATLEKKYYMRREENEKVEDTLRNYIMKIRPTYLRNNVISLIGDFDASGRAILPDTDLSDGDFDKYIYLIDFINSKHVIKPMIEKYPNICAKAMLDVAEEYKKLKYYCHKKVIQAELDFKNETDELKKMAHLDKMRANAAFCERLEALSKKITEEVVSKIKNEEMGAQTVAYKGNN